MTLKDFKVDDPVFMIKNTAVLPNTSECNVGVVTKVTRKYVYVYHICREYRFYEGANCPDCLIEDEPKGTPYLLFSSVDNLGSFIEKRRLQRWVMENTNWLKISEYSLDQLRQVKHILAPKENEDVC